MHFEHTSLPGCLLIRGFRAVDSRGFFAKCFSDAIWPDLKLAECFYTVSSGGTLRGMHLQEPPFHQYKLVFCAGGRAFDALIDLRVDSPTYGAVWSHVLTAEEPLAVLVAPGVAHGFLALEEKTILVYSTTSRHSPPHDKGVRWDSIGLEWPFVPAQVSDRDSALPALADYRSPFHDGFDR